MEHQRPLALSHVLELLQLVARLHMPLNNRLRFKPHIFQIEPQRLQLYDLDEHLDDDLPQLLYHHWVVVLELVDLFEVEHLTADEFRDC